MKYFANKRNILVFVRHIHWILLICLLFTVAVTSSTQDAPQAFDCNTATGITIGDCNALVDLYNSTGGNTWQYKDGWLVDTAPCNWYGVYCGPEMEFAFNDGVCPDVSFIGLPTDRVAAVCMEGEELTGNNMVGTVPGSFAQLTELRELWFGGNIDLKGLEPVGELPSLEHVVLRNMRLTSMPAIWPPDPEVDSPIKSLTLDTNRLSELPPQIGQFKNLVGLGLFKNQLETLPTQIGELTNLTGLGLVDNSLKTLPDEISALTQLVDLDLADNDLSSLPGSMSALTGLKRLILNNNRFRVMPEVLQGMDGLEGFTIIDNGINTLPDWLPEVGVPPEEPINDGSPDFPNAVSINVIDGNAINPDEVPQAVQDFLDRPNPFDGQPYDWRSLQFSAPTPLQASVTERSTIEPGKVTFTWEPIARSGDIGFYEISCAPDGKKPFGGSAKYMASTIDLATDTLTMTGLSAGDYDCAIRTQVGPRLLVTSFRYRSNPSSSIDVLVNETMKIPNDQIQNATAITTPQFLFALGDFNRAKASVGGLPQPKCADVSGLKSVFFEISTPAEPLRGVGRGPGQFVFGPHTIKTGGSSDFGLGKKFFIDTVLAVYRQNNNNKWVQIACNDNVPGSKSSQLNLELNPDERYRIGVWGKEVVAKNAILKNLLLQALRVYVRNGTFEAKTPDFPNVPLNWEYRVNGLPAPYLPLLICEPDLAYAGNCAMQLWGMPILRIEAVHNVDAEVVASLAACDKIKLSAFIRRRNLYDLATNGWQWHDVVHVRVNYTESTETMVITVRRGDDSEYQEIQSKVLQLSATPQSIQVILQTDEDDGSILFDNVQLESRSAEGETCAASGSLIPVPDAPVPDLLRGN